jgi:hypothetical protein
MILEKTITGALALFAVCPAAAMGRDQSKQIKRKRKRGVVVVK